MTNEELSQALRALADEFGAKYEESLSAHDDTYREYKLQSINARLAVTARYCPGWRETTISASAESLGTMTQSVTLGLGYTDVILVWLRAKLLELTREERIKRFDELLSELEYAHKYALNFNEATLLEGELRKLAFGGKQ